MPKPLPPDTVFDMPIVTTHGQVIEHYNRWAAANGKRLRVREGPPAVPLEWFDPTTGQTVR